MKVAVTGASGHIGANLIRKLIDRGDKVRVLQYKTNLAFKGLDVSIEKGDLNNMGSLIKLCDEAEIVYHLAARISIGNFIPSG